MRKKVHSSWLIVRSLLIFMVVFVAHCYLGAVAYAKEITILYTGETHAMLYPCNCPKEPDGGISRRATLIKQIRKNNPHTLVLDSGGFFAGGLLDEYTQNTDLDKERTRVNLKAMGLMQYAAVAVGDDEFNFGREFLEENIAKSNFAFLSCNISAPAGKSGKISPYVIREVAGIKFGIIGLTSLSAAQKSGGLKFIEPRIALVEALEKLKAEGADIIVLLSHLGEKEDELLIKEIGGINILITGHSFAKEEPPAQIGSTLVLRPSWQGRKLGKLSLTIKDNKISGHKIEELRLSDKVRDDPDILKILPRCFSDADCKNKGFTGICQGPGTLGARCQFNASSKVNLLVITPREKDCYICDTKTMVGHLGRQFPGLSVSYLYYPDPKALEMIDDIAAKGLPVYLLGREIEKEKSFDNLRSALELKGGFYMLKPEASGISYFLDRKPLKGQLDLFISLYDKDTKELLDAIRDFKPTVHFLAAEKQKGGFDASKGGLEVEEYLRGVCVQKYYPQAFWDYIACRAKNIDSSWWEDCLGKCDAGIIKACARSDEGRDLLRENIRLNKEIQALFGPAYLLDNQQVFATQGVPKKDEFKKILKR